MCESASNGNAKRCLQLTKDELEMVSIDEGRQIERSDEQPSNPESATVERAEPRSNVTIKRLLQRPKQSSGIVTIEEGIQIDRSDGQE
jgi:hypothetical protein